MVCLVLLRVRLWKNLQKIPKKCYYKIVIGSEKDLYPDPYPKKDPDPECPKNSDQHLQ